MKKNITRFTALSLSLVLLLGLTACGGGKKDPSADVPATTPVGEDALPPRWNIDEGNAEPGEFSEPDPLLLNFDFPNAGKYDGNRGTVNALKYIVTLHDGVEVELNEDVETQCIKLEGFGKASSAAGNAYYPLDEEHIVEVPFDSLTWDSLEPYLRQAWELKDDAVFQVTANGDNGPVYDCAPQKIERVSISENYGHKTPYSAGLYVYNPTEGKLPCTQCKIAAINTMTSLSDEGVHGRKSYATDVYALLGEPAFATVSWSGLYDRSLTGVYYYWVCDGFYARYEVFYETHKHGGTYGQLQFFVDDPAVMEEFMDATAIATLRGE